jgi:hypothetical protein
VSSWFKVGSNPVLAEERVPTMLYRRVDPLLEGANPEFRGLLLPNWVYDAVLFQFSVKSGFSNAEQPGGLQLVTVERPNGA